MYSGVSTGFATAITQKNQTRSYKCIVTYKNASGEQVTETLDASKWEMGSTSIKDGCLPGSYFSLGGTVSRSIATVLKNEDGRFTGCKFAGGVLKPFFGLWVNGAFEWVPLGIFVIDSCSKTTAKSISIAASDKMIKAEKLLSDCNITFPITLSALAQALATAIGVTLQSTTFNNSDLTMNEPADKTKVTIRELISGVAAVAGGFARINYNGNLEFVSFTLANPTTIAGDAIRYAVDVGEPNTIDSAVYYGSKRNFIKGDSEGLYPVSIEANALFENLSGGTDDITTILNTVLVSYQGLTITPVKLDFAGDPRLQAGDPVYLPSTADGDITTILTSINLTITASSDAECVECDAIDIDFYNSSTSTSTPTITPTVTPSTGDNTKTHQNLLNRCNLFYPFVDAAYNAAGTSLYNRNVDGKYGPACIMPRDYGKDGGISFLCRDIRPGRTYTFTWTTKKASVSTSDDWVLVFRSYNYSTVGATIGADEFSYNFTNSTIGGLFCINSFTFTIPEDAWDPENVNVYDMAIYPKTSSTAGTTYIQRVMLEEGTDWEYYTDGYDEHVTAKYNYYTGLYCTGAIFKNNVKIKEAYNSDDSVYTFPIVRQVKSVSGAVPDGYPLKLYHFSSANKDNAGYAYRAAGLIRYDDTNGLTIIDGSGSGAGGADGEDGVGIDSITQNGNILTINLTDGTSETVTIPVVDGEDGVGISGITQSNNDMIISMTDGTSYTIALPTTGTAGEDGVGIANITQSGNNLIISMTDGTSYTVTLPSGSSGTGTPGTAGKDGVGIQDITQNGNTLTITLTDGTVETFTISTVQGEVGPQGPQGPQGEQGPQGDDGVGISNITQDGANLIISMTDGTSYTVTIPTSSSDGTGTGADGEDGVGIQDITQDGANLIISMTDGTSYTVTVPTVQGPQGPQGEAGVGIQSIEQTTTSTVDGGTNIITCTLTDGTTSTFSIRNGSKGADGASGGGTSDGGGTSTGACNISSEAAAFAEDLLYLTDIDEFLVAF